MSKFDIGVGEDFPLDESSREGECAGRHERRHRHFHGHHHHHHDHDEHEHDHGHPFDHHRFHMAALAALFALKAYRRRMRQPVEPL
jgi:hypothetical protein